MFFNGPWLPSADAIAAVLPHTVIFIIDWIVPHTEYVALFVVGGRLRSAPRTSTVAQDDALPNAYLLKDTGRRIAAAAPTNLLLLDVIWAQPLTDCLTLASYFLASTQCSFHNFVDQ